MSEEDFKELPNGEEDFKDLPNGLPFTALCISAGGSKGFAALGALQCLIDHQILDFSQVRFMSGTSIGSAICFFLSIGYKPVELMIELCTNNWTKGFVWRSWDDMITNESLYDTEGMMTRWEEMCFSKMPLLPTMKSHYEQTGITLVICTYNYTKRQVEYIRHDTHPDMPCLQALKMSSTLPFLFPPTVWNQEEYLDGAFADDFPIEQLPFLTQRTLGIYLDDEASAKESTHRIFRWVQKVFSLMSIPMLALHQRRLQQFKRAPFLSLLTLRILDTPVYQIDLRKDQQLDLFSNGYHQAKERLNDFAFKAQTA